MTVLALTGAQTAALLLATAAVVLVLFFLKLRRPPVLVSSVLLWDRLLRRDAPRSWRERLRRALSLALVLAIALAVAFALGRPVSSSASRGVAVVVDSSPTMSARTREGSTRLEAARRQARRILEEHSAAPRFLVGDTGGTPPVQAFTLADALAAVEAIVEAPYAGVPALPDDVTAFLVTDGVTAAAPPAPIATVPVFEPVPNVALADFAVDAAAPDEPLRARFTVVNDGPAAVTATLDVRGPEGAARTQRFTLEAGERRDGSLELGSIGEGAVTASLSADRDGFAADDTAADFVPRRRPVLVALVAAGRGPLRAALAADPRVELVELSEGASAAAALRGADVIVYDAVAPAGRPPAPALVLGPARTGAAVADRVRFGEVLDTPPPGPVPGGHPILSGVTWTDVSVSRAAALEVDDAAGARALMVSAAGVPLLSALADPRLVVAGFAVSDTDLPLRPAFPLLVRNAVHWLAGDATVMRAPTGVVALDGAAVTVRTAAGAEVSVRSSLGTTVFDAARPGVYVADLDGERLAIVVNRPRGDAGPNAPTTEAAGLPPPRPRAGSDWWPTLLLAALALAALEWWTYHRRITV